jgi:ribose 5-phosphate isomerase A
VSDIEKLKLEAAIAAIDFVKNDMVIGLGSGSTATYAIEALAKKVADGLKILAIPSSKESSLLAKKHGIQLTTFAENPVIDLTIDGADQVELKSLNLVKGLGNALLGEKIVARASKRLIIIVDESKLVDCLGNKTPLPLEIVPFGWELTKQIVSQHGCDAELKLDSNNNVIITDSGHYVLHCQFAKIENARKLDKDLKLITGVVETGLFVNMADLVIMAKQSGVVTLQRE